MWFYPGPPVSSTNNIDHRDITEILLKVALNTITITLTIGSLLFATHSVFSIRVFVEILYCQSWKTKGIIVPIMPSSQVHYNFSTHLFIII